MLHGGSDTLDGGSNEAAGVHHFSRRRRGCFAACGAYAAGGADAARWNSDAISRSRRTISKVCSRAAGRACRTRLDRRQQRAIRRAMDHRQLDRVRGGAVQLLDLKPDVIVVWSHRATSVLHQQASPIPVVFVGVGDPVETGLVTSLAKPGGSLTGFTVLENSVVGKMLELLKQISPGMNRAALIFNPENPTAVVIPRWFEAAAVALTVRATLAPVHAPDEIERAVQSFAREPNGALLFSAGRDRFNSSRVHYRVSFTPSPAGDIWGRCDRREWRPDVVWNRYYRPVAASGVIC